VDLRRGDCLLYRPKGFFGWVIATKTWHPVAHVEVYAGNDHSWASRDGLGVNLYPIRMTELAYVLRPTAPVDLARALRLLGRHIRELALELPRARGRQLARRARDAEVAEARAPVDSDEDVLRRDVAVDDAERLAVVVLELVGGVEPREHVDDDAEPHLRVLM